MSINRVRGDNYPIQAVLKVNGVPVDLTGSTIVFSYIKSDSQTSSSINGTIVSAIDGTVQFSPGVNDFLIAGTYKYDIQRTVGSIKTTHDIGDLIIADDITK